MNSHINPKAKQIELVIQESADEVLIYDLRTNKAFCLNQTAAFVWHHADGETSVEQIASLLQKKLKTSVDESIIWLALERLEKDGLLENKTPAPHVFAGMNRRELIKTFGKSAMVALPLVTMLVAPTAASAASGLPDGSTCTSSSQCNSGTCSAGKCCTPAGASCGGAQQCCGNLGCSADATCRSRSQA